MDAFGDAPNPPNRVISQMPTAPPATAAAMLNGSSNTVFEHSVAWLRVAGLNAHRYNANVAPTPPLSWSAACTFGR